MNATSRQAEEKTTEKAALEEALTPWKVHSVLDWLLNNYLIVKMGLPRSTAPYKITEKGIMFLKILHETYRES